MIGALDPQLKDVHVVGGGISGMLAAYACHQKGYRVHLYEAKDYLGGIVSTVHGEYGMAEAAANSLLATPPVRQLFTDLGVALTPVNTGHRSKYIWRGGRLRKLPLTIPELFAAIARAGFCRATKDDFSVYDYACTHFGKAAADYLFTPMVTGIYAADPRAISMRAAFPRLTIPVGRSFLTGFSRQRSGAKDRPMMAPALGMGALIEALAGYLQSELGARVHLDHSVEHLPTDGNVVVTTPAPVTAKFLGIADLPNITYTPLMSVSVFYPRAATHAVPRGVGALFPLCENRRILGVLFSGDSFPGRTSSGDVTSYTVLLGGHARPELLDLSDTEILAVIAEELRETLRIDAPMLDAKIFRWPTAIPRYDAALERYWEQVRKDWAHQPGRVLFSNYSGQVSIRALIETLDDF